MKRTYSNQGSGGPSYSSLVITDGSVEAPGQLSVRVASARKAFFVSVILDDEQIEDLRQFLNERAKTRPVPVPVKKIVVEP